MGSKYASDLKHTQLLGDCYVCKIFCLHVIILLISKNEWVKLIFYLYTGSPWCLFKFFLKKMVVQSVSDWMRVPQEYLFVVDYLATCIVLELEDKNSFISDFFESAYSQIRVHSYSNEVGKDRFLVWRSSLCLLHNFCMSVGVLVLRVLLCLSWFLVLCLKNNSSVCRPCALEWSYVLEFLLFIAVDTCGTALAFNNSRCLLLAIKH